MGIRKKLRKIFSRRQRHAIEFEKDCLQKKYDDFIHAISKLEDDSIYLKKKYALHYFYNEDYDTPLFYPCLQIPEKFRNGTKVHDYNALVYLKGTLIDFVKAFQIINEFDEFIRQQITKMENFKLLFQKLLSFSHESIIDVQEHFSKEEIEQSTEKYVAMLQEKKETDFHGLTREKYAERLMGFVIVRQFCIFLYLCRKCSQDLQPLFPHKTKL